MFNIREPVELTQLNVIWSTYRLVFLQEPALTEKEVSLLEENIDDPISAVKQLGRVSFVSDSLNSIKNTKLEMFAMVYEVTWSTQDKKHEVQFELYM